MLSLDQITLQKPPESSKKSNKIRPLAGFSHFHTTDCNRLKRIKPAIFTYHLRTKVKIFTYQTYLKTNLERAGHAKD